MFEFCPNCNTKTIQKPLFTSFYEECPKCDGLNEAGGMGLNSNQVNIVFKSVFKHGDFLIHSGTGIKGKVVFVTSSNKPLISISDTLLNTITDYEEAFQKVSS